ncbi:MAG: gst 2 [Alphaproteobacteria bacterium]|jgi:glutathione S-transferase|nr:gst 2 [Alphaproteobacteria bacterium]
MSVTIYGVAASRTMRPLWAALELGIDFKHEPIAFGETGSRKPEFRSVNPNGKIPALKDGDLLLFESMAIDWYLVRKYDNGKGLAPRNLEEEAAILQWTFWAMTEVEKQIIEWAFNAFVWPAERRAPKVAEAAMASIQAPLQVLDQALAGKQWLVGERFTLADLNVAAVLYRLLQADLSHVPNVQSWLRLCLERPAALAMRKMRE